MSGNLSDPYQIFQVEPRTIESGKAAFHLANSDILGVSMQVVARGGETNLHAHTAAEEIWLVVKGEATFWGEGGRKVAQLGPFGGILIPRGTPYSFESSAPEPLVILRFGTTKEGVVAQRIDYTPQPELIQKLRRMRRETDEPVHVAAD